MMLLKTIALPNGSHANVTPGWFRHRNGRLCELVQHAKMPRKGQRQLEFETPADPGHELVHDDPAARRHATVQEFKRILDRIVKIEIHIGEGNLCRKLARFYRIPDPTFF